MFAVDATLVEMAEQAFGLGELRGTHLIRADGRTGLEGLPEARSVAGVRQRLGADTPETAYVPAAEVWDLVSGYRARRDTG